MKSKRKSAQSFFANLPFTCGLSSRKTKLISQPRPSPCGSCLKPPKKEMSLLELSRSPTWNYLNNHTFCEQQLESECYGQPYLFH